MYAQDPRGARLPRNYGGNAFRYPPIRTEEEPLVEPLVEPHEVPHVVPPLAEERALEEADVGEQTVIAETAGKERAEEARDAAGEDGGGDVRSVSHQLLPSFGARGIGSEELLLLGMLLLLGGEGKNDLMMCLLILLFCG